MYQTIHSLFESEFLIQNSECKQILMNNVFFEKQSYFSLQCGLYSVNHILGSKVYSKNDFNDICYSLSDQFINPHKHPFGGDFDVNVLIIALQRQGLQVVWFDRRQDLLVGQPPMRMDQKKIIKKQKEDQKRQDEKGELIGYLINRYCSGSHSIVQRICGFSKRHWLAVRKIGDRYYWLDSKEDTFRSLTQEQAQVQMTQLLSQGTDERNQILIVYRRSKQ